MSYINENNDGTENGVVAELASMTAQRSEEIIAGSEDTVVAPIAVHSTVYKNDERLDFRTHEKFLEEPARRRGITRVRSVESLVKLENRYVQDQSITFTDLEKRTITTVIDFDCWKVDRISYSTDYHPDFKEWLRLNDQWMSQLQFAEMLQDLRHTIVEPRAADVMQIARTFTATRTANFESGVRTQNGDVQFSYVEETRANSASLVEIPETIILNLPIYRDSTNPVQVHLDFRYNAAKDGLKLGFRIMNVDHLLEGAWDALVEQASEGLKSMIVEGPAPEAVQPWE